MRRRSLPVRFVLVLAVLSVAASSCGGKPTAPAPTWTAARPVAKGVAVTALSCASSSFCLGLAYDYATRSRPTVVWNGSRWRVLSGFPDGASPTGEPARLLSCVATRFCMASDGADAWTWDGQGWSEPASLPGSPGTPGVAAVAGLSCASQQFCMAVTGQGQVDTFDGHRWSGRSPLPALPRGGAAAGDTSADSVSCPAPTSCTAASGDGYAFFWNGQSWAAPLDVDPPGGLAVSCPTTTWCLFINQQSYAAIWDGRSWTGPRFVDPDSMSISQGAGERTAVSWGQGDFGLIGLSCAGDRSCVAIDDAGYAVRLDGGLWSEPTKIGTPLDNTELITCGGPGMCMAVVDAGQDVRIERS